MCAPRYVDTISSGWPSMRCQHDQRLHLARLIKTVSRFRFNRGGAVPRKIGYRAARLSFQLRRRRVAHRLHARENAAARLGDLVIVRAANAHLVVQQPGLAENQVRVAVHKTGHHHAAPGIHLDHVVRAGGSRSTSSAATRGFNHAVADQDGSVRNDADIAQSRTAPGTSGPRKVKSWPARRINRDSLM